MHFFGMAFTPNLLGLIFSKGDQIASFDRINGIFMPLEAEFPEDRGLPSTFLPLVNPLYFMLCQTNDPRYFPPK